MGMAAPQVYNVPWRLRMPDLPPVTAGLVLYWFPSSVQEVQKSSMRTSRIFRFMRRNASRWKSPTRPLRWDKSWWARTSCPLPFWLLPAEIRWPKLKTRMVSCARRRSRKSSMQEMKHRDNSLEQQLKQAKEHAKSGDSTGAIPLYRAVLDQKCLFPKRAKDAAKELKKLGVNDVGDILNSPDYRFPCL